MRIRGGEANHTLILIDGVEAAGGNGEYILSGLESANIERAEVLRGPQSVYYGCTGCWPHEGEYCAAGGNTVATTGRARNAVIHCRGKPFRLLDCLRSLLAQH